MDTFNDGRPFRAGRDFTERDTASATGCRYKRNPGRKLFGRTNPIGQIITQDGGRRFCRRCWQRAGTYLLKRALPTRCHSDPPDE